MEVESALVLTARICLGVVFLTSGAGKLTNTHRFTQAVRDYEILPEQMIKPYALLVTGGELIFGAMMLSGFMLNLAALGLTFLLFSFALAVVVNS